MRLHFMSSMRAGMRLRGEPNPRKRRMVADNAAFLNFDGNFTHERRDHRDATVARVNQFASAFKCSSTQMNYVSEFTLIARVGQDSTASSIISSSESLASKVYSV